jgi:uncharacterized protein DUF4190
MSYDNPPPPPPPQYGAPVPGMPAQPQKTSGMAIASLVTGILGIFPCCGIGILGLLGVIFGVLAKKNIEASNGAEKGLGLAKAGLICGAIGLVLTVIYWILVAAGGIDYNFTTN